MNTQDTTIYDVMNNTEKLFSEHLLIHEAFEASVAKVPNKTALVMGDVCLTYSELNKLSNGLATQLRKKGVGPDIVVPIIVERSMEMIIGVLAILKAGGAYLPISPSDPSERIIAICKDCNAKISLVSDHMMHLKVNCLYISRENLYNWATEVNPTIVNTSNNLAYVIYTSGSTGKPKGVMIEHKSVINRLQWMQFQFPITSKDILLQKTPFCFDVSVWELFWWFFEEAKLCLLKPNEEKFPRAIIDTILFKEVSTIHFVPSMFGVFLGYFKTQKDQINSLRQIFCSGEVLSAALVQSFNEDLNVENKTKLINLYGPTEATVDVSYHVCGNEEKGKSKIPIGKPIHNTKLWILENDKLVGETGVGELCISGVGLARGYINRVQLTSERFVYHPALDGLRIYKTGDLASIQSNGNVDFLGRIDNQVKIRGLRIELGEIEAVMTSYLSVANSLVITKKYSESVTLILGYFESEKEVNVLDFKKYLATKLPSYMIPNRIIQVEEIMLTSNGKKDRRRMSELELVK